MKKFFLASVFASVSAPFMLAGFSFATAPAFWLRVPAGFLGLDFH
jgi:hypothetical protein